MDNFFSKVKEMYERKEEKKEGKEGRKQERNWKKGRKRKKEISYGLRQELLETQTADISAKTGNKWEPETTLCIPVPCDFKEQSKHKNAHPEPWRDIQSPPILLYLEWVLTEAPIPFDFCL